MPSFDSFVVGEDFVSEHYFTTDTTKAGESFQAEVIKLRRQWDDVAIEGHESPLQRFTKARGELQISLAALAEEPDKARTVYLALRAALGFYGPSSTFKSERSGAEMLAHNVWSSPNGELLFVEAMPADALEDALSKDRSELPDRPLVDDKPMNYSASKLISELYRADEKPQFIVLMAGRWLVLTEGERWAEGRYLAADALLAVERNDTKRGGELDRFLAVFGHDSLHPDANEQIWWNSVLEASVKHTVGVSKDLREGIRLSIEIIANDVLVRRTAQGLANNNIDGKDLASQCLRFLYRILFLLYAEASPEMGILPVGDERYDQGYGLDRIRELVLNPLASEKAKHGTHLYDSLNRLFTLVNTGHHAADPEDALTFERLEADLFSVTATKSIDDVKLSNAALQKVLEHLLLSKEARGKDRGFISYAELGVNQLGAVYEGLMSYTGFIAQEDLYEVAKEGDSTKGSWVVPVERSGDIEDRHFVKAQDEITGEWKSVLHERGAFVFRLAGRERQQSASYYTPEVLTKFVVSQALEELLDQGGTTTPADRILKLTVCEPALGSGAFAIEAVRQLAAEYLRRKQEELNVQIPADEYPLELQKVKAQIALHQVHGVDLNATAVELAEVSLWLDTMVAGLQAPWFGLRLRRGNSLIGARRATYSVSQIKDKSWLTSTPQDAPLSGLAAAVVADGDDPAVVGRVHHFLLPAQGWGAASDASEVKELAGDAQKILGKWRKSVRVTPTKPQMDRLLGLSRRVEDLWKLVLRRLEVAKNQARREIDYFGKSDSHGLLESKAVTRAEIEAFVGNPDSSYRRLRLVMDAWNALWFWPLTEQATKGVLPPSTNDWIEALESILGTPATAGRAHARYGRSAGQTSLLSQASWADLETAESIDSSLAGAKPVAGLVSTFPWIRVSEEVSAEQGFLHWELDFAPVFARGGFDLQVGNPPWVRPRSDMASLMAEHDPWWALNGKSTRDVIEARRTDLVRNPAVRAGLVESATPTPIVATILSSSSRYELLTGQPDLFRAFMCRTWASTKLSGVVALVHPESHFGDPSAGLLRSAAYVRLRRHWEFENAKRLFEIDRKERFGVHVYGSPQALPNFIMAANLYSPAMVEGSLKHPGESEPPGLRHDDGTLDERPHRDRIFTVTEDLLSSWAQILDTPDTVSLQARMLYPVNEQLTHAISLLAESSRVRDWGARYSRGWDESIARAAGYFDFSTADERNLTDAVLIGRCIGQGSVFGQTVVAGRGGTRVWEDLDLEDPLLSVPFSGYKPEPGRPDYDSKYGVWDLNGRPRHVRNQYRVAWRRRAKPGNARSLYVGVLAPGHSHVNAVMSAGFEGRGVLALAGFLSSLPIDFMAKVAALEDIYPSSVDTMPFILDHPLVGEIEQLAAELNCLTSEYADLWEAGWTPSWSLPAKWSTEHVALKARDRRQAMVKLDAAVSVAIGLSVDELIQIYRVQFSGLRRNYEQRDLYDITGRKLPSEVNKNYRRCGDELTLEERTWTHPQSGVKYVFELPFVSYDREEDMRKAYAHFAKLLAEKS